MLKKIILLLLILIGYSFICNKIYTYYQPQKEMKTKNTTVEKKPEKNYSQPKEIKNTTKDTSIGIIKIKKINLTKKLYSISDKKNNIEENVTILKNSEEPSKENSIMFIAAHSGSGPLAYFKNLNKLQEKDIIELTYKNIKYIYEIKDIWETKKTGTISVNKENTTQLILTTCSPTQEDKQLIINSILIEKES